MARYDAEHKQATRRRILETAGRRFKSDGIDGSGVATLMADADLTNGAFYAHFASKDDLVAQVVSDQLQQQCATITALPPGRAALEAFVREYLSVGHRDAPGDGCASAALLDEVGRRDDATRQAYTAGVRGVVDAIAGVLSPRNPTAAHGRALGLFTLLVGTLQLARAVSDREFSDDVLEQGVTHALKLAR